MLKCLDRNIASASERIVFLAPSTDAVSDVFPNATVDAGRYGRLLAEMQRFRGAIYVKDGALQPHQLTADGRHKTEEDDASWHMLLLDEDQRVGACAMYLEHDPAVAFDELRVRHCALAQDRALRPRLINAVQSELERAQAENLRYVELGGWAVSEQTRGTAASIALALSVYGFSRRDAGALGMTTATFRHCSATILKRLGGSRFEVDGQPLEPYFDPRYRCLMELLRFDSRKPNPKYLSLIDQVRDTLHRINVIVRPSWAFDGVVGVPAPAAITAHALAS
jgi:hypothetical protein